MNVRAATAADADGIWAALEPAIRAGETYALPRDMTREAGLAYWCAPHHHVFVAADGERVVGSYFVKANQAGGGAHVANAGYIVPPDMGGRGIARAMCAHSLDVARGLGFRAMQFNFVVSTNEAAVRAWQASGFAIVGRLPGAFAHPRLGDVDALVMHRWL